MRPLELTDAQIMTARRMARQGDTIEAIHAALDSNVSPRSLRDHLRKHYGIRVASVIRHAHDGDETCRSHA